ncbi:MAG: VWA domain-containing protein, partial [Myxococcales bacterium]|nr:VWA domain-containing protein [Myxococcales bacterium]
DNSGSMGEEQATLSNNFGAFVRVLEAADVRANYRIGITTTDMGNPRCGPDFFKAPAAGDLQLSSCRDRLGDGGGKSDFIFDAGVDVIDATSACTDYCQQSVHDALAAGIKPTPIEDFSDGERPRKWIESTYGVTNLPDELTSLVAGFPVNNDASPQNDVSPAEVAFQCYGPQGIIGCGFESPLQAMYFALGKADTPGQLDNYGFSRRYSVLSVVFVTDEADCSFNNAEIFTSNQVFWEPGTNGATSAVCWNAGVLCDGAAPGPYSECHAADFDANGQLLDPGDPSTDEDAALIPVKRFVDQLQAIEDEKRSYQADREVLVSVIGGVPPDYSSGGAEILYLDASDPDEQALFGIGPGCSTQLGGSAIPPVRMREFAEAFAVGADRNLYSICESDYTGALEAIADSIRDLIKPACYPECVGDTDPQTPLLEPSCALEQEVDGVTTPIPECLTDGDDSVLPDGAEVCFAYLVDQADLTPSSSDDMSDDCVSAGWNLEFRIIRDEPAPISAVVSANCQLSAQPELDCPNLDP